MADDRPMPGPNEFSADQEKAMRQGQQTPQTGQNQMNQAGMAQSQATNIANHPLNQPYRK